MQTYHEMKMADHAANEALRKAQAAFNERMKARYEQAEAIRSIALRNGAMPMTPTIETDLAYLQGVGEALKAIHDPSRWLEDLLGKVQRLAE